MLEREEKERLGERGSKKLPPKNGERTPTAWFKKVKFGIAVSRHNPVGIILRIR
jgi:hypothetical protein